MTRQAPRFRPRRTKAQQSSRRYLLLAGVAGAAVLVGVGIVLAVVLSGDDTSLPAVNALPTASSQSTAGTLGGPDTLISTPVAGLVVQTADLKDGRYKSLEPETYPVSAIGFATNGYFVNAQAGEQQALAWGYKEGYQSSFEPDGQLAGVLQGRYYIRVEAYAFDAVGGAQQAYAFLEQQHRSRPRSVEEPGVKGLALQSSAFKITGQKVGSSELSEVFHRFLFRRGNLVVVVQTLGAEPFLNIDKARDLAVLVDEKALGQRPAPTPTPAKSVLPGSLQPAAATPTPKR